MQTLDHQGASRDKDLAQRIERAGNEAEIAAGAAPLAFDQAHLSQHFQVVADGALREVEERLELADAPSSPKKSWRSWPPCTARLSA